MNVKEIEKNILDLAYKRHLQLLNVILIIGAGTFVAYLAGFVLNQDKILQYTTLLIIIGVITYFLYNKIDDRLKEISAKIKKLSIR